MPTIFVPAEPYPKQANDNIRSSDWNAAINEVSRLSDTTQNLNRNTFNGPLTVKGALTVDGEQTVNGVLGVKEYTRISYGSSGNWAVFGVNMYNNGSAWKLVDLAYKGASLCISAQGGGTSEFRFNLMDAGEQNNRTIASIGTGGLTVTGNQAVSGELTVTGLLKANGGINGPLTVKGALTVDTTLTVTGAATAKAALTVQGALTASAGLTVTGNQAVNGVLGVSTYTRISQQTSGNWAIFGANMYNTGTGFKLVTTTYPGANLHMSAQGGGTSQFRFCLMDANEVNQRNIATIGTEGIVSNGKAVATGHEFLYMIRGRVSGNGTKAEGTGFTSQRLSTGLYQINFSPAFTATPTAVATQYITTNSDTRDNAVIVGLANSFIKVRVGNGIGEVADREFMFIAAGPRTT